MYEYGIYNEITGERSVMFGYSIEDARRRSKIDDDDWKDWVVYYCDYVD